VRGVVIAGKSNLFLLFK